VTLTGPVGGGTRGEPFALGFCDLPGYRLAEYFLGGTAAAYRLSGGGPYAIDGRWCATVDRHALFTTRLLVAYPADPTAFSGIVIVSWQNVTAGFEVAMPPADLVARGLAFVGVSAQRVGIQGYSGTEAFALRCWDGERYGALEHPGDDFSFDIFTQAARSVGPDRPTHREPDRDPLGGLDVTHVMAHGVSQSALRLRGYLNAIQPIERVFDGCFLALDVGAGALLDTRESDTSVPLRVPHAPTRIRDDLSAPVFVVNSESETVRYAPVRQADSEVFRLWEIAGVAHVRGPGEEFDQLARQGERLGIPASALAHGTGPDANALSHRPVQRAAFRHFLSWVEDGRPPPDFPLIELEEGDPAVIRRDGDGNAVGGFRLPDLDVALASHRGIRDSEVMLQRLSGSSCPLPADRLRRRFGTSERYMQEYSDSLDAAIAAGCLVPEDRIDLLRAAEHRAYKLLWPAVSALSDVRGSGCGRPRPISTDTCEEQP
jgi:hypothetical protein